jgi:hypothetical protein
MITVYYRNVTPCVIRPTPFVSISYSAQRNKIGTLGGSYDITLTGTIIDDEGSPLLFDNSIKSTGNFSTDYARPASQSIGLDQKLRSILQKQNVIRELFSSDGQRIEILPISNDPGNGGINTGGSDEPIMVFYPTIQSVNFEEGIYVNTCKYTITLKADTILDAENKVYLDGVISNTFSNSVSSNDSLFYYNDERLTQESIINTYGGFVEDFTENWAIEVDDQNGITNTYIDENDDTQDSIQNIRTYRLTRNMNATGKVTYYPSGNNGTVVKSEAWKQAKDFIKKKIAIANDGVSEYPRFDIELIFAKDFLNLSNLYGGYNHSRTENIDKTNGQYSLTDTWLLSSGTAYENYNMSISSSIDAPLINLSIQGTIKGLTSIPISGALYGGNDTSPINSPYQNAVNKYRQISNNGQYGLTSALYKRAQNAMYPIVPNAQPKSLSLGLNAFTGEITYTLEFNNRPMNYISGVLSENISISDTYPGDVFAVIPVIGRQTGPILQYIGGRTEYQRSVGIEFNVDYTNLPYGRNRNSFVLSKPSLNEPIRTQINELITSLSPANEPGIRKYFLNPPAESWNPKDGKYSLNLNWTYELDH